MNEILKGRQFFPAEILPTLETARVESYKRYLDNDDPAWLKQNVLVARLKVKINKFADATESANGLAVVIRPGHPLWAEINEVLRGFNDVPSVMLSIQALPRDLAAPALTVPGWVVPVASAGAVVVIFSLAWWWLKGKKA